MVRFGAITKLLMLLAALVPFTSERQVVGALAPYIPLAPLTPEREAPTPASEEDDERETAGGKERLAASARHRPAGRELVGTLRSARPARRLPAPPVQTTPTFSVDPFRNGLGTPYRC